MRRNVTRVVLAIAVAVGLCAAYVDSRPGWDDTGINAAAVFIATAALSFFRPRAAPFIALAVGAWIPLVEIAQSRNFGSLLAFVIAAIGALCGAGFGAIVSHDRVHDHQR